MGFVYDAKKADYWLSIKRAWESVRSPRTPESNHKFQKSSPEELEKMNAWYEEYYRFYRWNGEEEELEMDDYVLNLLYDYKEGML